MAGITKVCFLTFFVFFQEEVGSSQQEGGEEREEERGEPSTPHLSEHVVNS